MSTFDYIMIVNTALALWRQVAIAHCHISNFGIAMVMNLGFSLAYVSEELWSGLVFSLLHTVLTGYGWYCWTKHKE